jgi:small-conductance mechanosensitive channel
VAETIEQWWNGLRYSVDLGPTLGFVEQWLGGNHVGEVVSTLLMIALAWLAIGFLRRRILRKVLLRPEIRFHLPYENILFISRVITGCAWILVVLVVLDIWNVNVTGIWTLVVSAAAIIGVGFLAVWTIISNITASLFLTIWRPFRLGHRVEVLPENLRGRVIDRNMMFTVLREEKGQVLQVPNNLFFQKIFRVSDVKMQSFFEELEHSPETINLPPSTSVQTPERQKAAE